MTPRREQCSRTSESQHSTARRGTGPDGEGEGAAAGGVVGRDGNKTPLRPPARRISMRLFSASVSISVSVASAYKQEELALARAHGERRGLHVGDRAKREEGEPRDARLR